jgi:hypothetical protein
MKNHLIGGHKMKKVVYSISFVAVCSILFFILIKTNILDISFSDKGVTKAVNHLPEAQVTEDSAEPIENNSPSEGKEQDEETNTPPITLVPYNGIVEHIFFHPLIVYPELAFDGDYQEQGYNDYFTTIPEFERIIEELYKRDFILVHLSDVYEEANGQVVARTLQLPEGKKPIVISIDDLNYYEYMIENGNAYKLILDENGKIATYSKDPYGNDVVSYTDEIVTILDTFVEKHPDFSHEGAKGTIALTGYEGILGYRTQEGSPNRASEIEEAKKIVAELKDTGWIFASHSYGHINVTNVSLNHLISDSEAWKREVEPLVGPTPLFIYPYGARADYNSEKFKYLVKSGFKVISAVGPTSYTKVINGAYTMDRRHMDGIGFILQPHTMTDLFDVNYVLDTVNRPKKYWVK